MGRGGGGLCNNVWPTRSDQEAVVGSYYPEPLLRSLLSPQGYLVDPTTQATIWKYALGACLHLTTRPAPANQEVWESS